VEYVWLLFVVSELFGKQVSIPIDSVYATKELCEDGVVKLKKEFPDSKFECHRVKIKTK